MCFNPETDIIHFKFFLMCVLLLGSQVSSPLSHIPHTFKSKNKAGVGMMK